MSVRLPDNFPLSTSDWQGFGQMKQAAPNCDPPVIPVLSFSAYNNVWSFWHTDNGPAFHTNTLHYNGNCSYSGISQYGPYTVGPGDPIPSHLRAGLYHNANIPCPAPSGCSIDIDNVQVVKP
jgi:hypothetical protein